MTASAAVAIPRPPDRLTLAAFVTLIVIGGAASVAIRFSNQELPPFWGATLRFAAASLIFAVMVIWLRAPLPRGRGLVGALIYGVLGFGVSYALTYWGFITIEAGLGQVILALIPLLTLVLAIVHGLERFRLRALVGALLAVAGIAVVYGGQAAATVPVWSVLALIAAGACIAESSIVVKWFPESHPAALNAVGMATGTVILLALSAVAGERWTVPTLASTWLALAYLVLMGSVPVFLLFVFVLRRWTASATSYMFVLLPFATVALGALIAQETVTTAIVLGGALVLAGVYVGAFTGVPRRS
ncbi:MAG TPA: EamA family transporter [Candidatus Limnocylindria bacterium]|nr:EamA family transporter [Candidatus Limnocylindria bacterium]